MSHRYYDCSCCHLYQPGSNLSTQEGCYGTQWPQVTKPGGSEAPDLLPQPETMPAS